MARTPNYLRFQWYKLHGLSLLAILKRFLLKRWVHISLSQKKKALRHQFCLSGNLLHETLIKTWSTLIDSKAKRPFWSSMLPVTPNTPTRTTNNWLKSEKNLRIKDSKYWPSHATSSKKLRRDRTNRSRSSPKITSMWSSLFSRSLWSILRTYTQFMLIWEKTVHFTTQNQMKSKPLRTTSPYLWSIAKERWSSISLLPRIWLQWEIWLKKCSYENYFINDFYQLLPFNLKFLYSITKLI